MTTSTVTERTKQLDLYFAAVEAVDATIPVTKDYRGNGNWDLFVFGMYAGTVWFS
jgi:hypothetical protein